MHYLATTTLLLLTYTSFAQLDSILINQLDSIKIEDQKWRNRIADVRRNTYNGSYSLETLQDSLQITDSLNLVWMKKIFFQYGFPPHSLVGEAGTHTFWLLVQHADSEIEFQKMALKSLKKLVDEGEAKEQDYAYLMDRVLINSGEKQLYGTQCQIKSDSTGYEIKPCKDVKNLDERRKKAGMSPIARYIEIMDEYYLPKKE